MSNHRDKKEMVGARYGRLTVVREVEPRIVGTKKRVKRNVFECLCDCGNTKNVTQLSLNTGNTKSCGCLAAELRKTPRSDYLSTWAGIKFEHLTVQNAIKYDARARVRLLCVCDCGKEIWVGVRDSATLMAKSCGCMTGKLIAIEKTKHGMCKRGEENYKYDVYQSTTTRARRLGLPCDFFGQPEKFAEWFSARIEALNFECPILGTRFVRGVGRWCDESPTVDRIEPSKGYVFGNIEVISHRANQIKNDASLEELISVCSYIKERVAI